jgi:tetratricopeptide (TPR) repeat protein
MGYSMLDQAIEHYKEALKIRRELAEIDESFKPKLANALNNLANAYYGKGLLDQAIEHYKEALKIRRELAEKDEKFRLQFTTSLIFLGIAFGTRGTEEDKVSSKKLQTEAKSMLQDPVVISSPQYPDLVSLAKILDSLVGKN